MGTVVGVSDLQCAATLLLVRPAERGPGQDAADHQVVALAERLRDRRVAAVLTEDDPESQHTARALARCLELAVRAGCVFVTGDGAAAGSTEAVDHWRVALEGVADVHRGETVVVVTSARDLAPALVRLAVDAPADLADHPLPAGGVAEVLVDADGWNLRSWPGVRGG